jgi:ABC-type nitrate/sulfonate/bicarbonate transport system substrate-binding protein
VRQILSLGVCLLLAGCGGVTSSSNPDVDTTLLLDGPPSALHAGIYLAMERGYDETEGVDLTVRRSGDPAALLGNGRVQAALLRPDQIEPAGAVCVMTFRDDDDGPFLCVLKTTLEDRRPAVLALVQALQRGYGEAEVDPESAVQAELAAVPSLDQAALAAELDEIGGSLALRPPTVPSGQEDRFDASLVKRISRD